MDSNQENRLSNHRPHPDCRICKGKGYTGTDSFNPQSFCDCSERLYEETEKHICSTCEGDGVVKDIDYDLTEVMLTCEDCEGTGHIFTLPTDNNFEPNL